MRMSLSFFAITETMAQDGFGNFENKSDFNQWTTDTWHSRSSFVSKSVQNLNIKDPEVASLLFRLKGSLRSIEMGYKVGK